MPNYAQKVETAGKRPQIATRCAHLGKTVIFSLKRAPIYASFVKLRDKKVAVLSKIVLKSLK